MLKRISILFIVSIVIVGSWLLLRFELREKEAAKAPQAAPLTIAARQDLRQSAATKIEAEPRRAGAAEVSLTEASPPLSKEDLENFALFQAGMGAFSSREAKEIGLSEDQQSAIALVVWQARRKLDELLAERATVSTNQAGATVLRFKLDATTATAVRNDTMDSVRDMVGPELWPKVRDSQSMMLIETDLDGFGANESTFTIKPKIVGKYQTLEVEMRREDRPGVVRTYQHAYNIFRAIYGPLAAKAGF